MEKIICDVCGTSYPETAEQCPICGCARPETGKTVTEDGGQSVSSKYVPVKGGRFSAKNVKKRAEENGTPIPPRNDDEDSEPEKSGTSIGMVIAVVALLLSICAVIVYIYINYSSLPSDEIVTDPTQTESVVQTTTTVPETEPPYVSCTGIELESHSVTLEEAGSSWLLHVTALPENCDDTPTFESKDPSVAQVSNDGKITAVADGKTAIVITCGEITAEFEVVCQFPTETTVPPTTAPKHENVRINKKDVTIAVGESFELTLKDGKGDIMDAKWEVDIEGIVKIDGNKITGAKAGNKVTISCEFEGKEYTCVVRVKKAN